MSCSKFKFISPWNRKGPSTYFQTISLFKVVDFRVLFSMALPFLYFFLSLFFLPDICFSCPGSVNGGTLKLITLSFQAQTLQHLHAKEIMISNAIMAPNQRSASMDMTMLWRTISFEKKELILQDVALGHSLLEGHCGFFYNFTDRIPNFDLLNDFQLQSFNYASLNCSLDVHIISRTLFPVLYDSVPCKDYNLYYWNYWSCGAWLSTLTKNRRRRSIMQEALRGPVAVEVRKLGSSS